MSHENRTGHTIVPINREHEVIKLNSSSSLTEKTKVEEQAGSDTQHEIETPAALEIMIFRGLHWMAEETKPEYDYWTKEIKTTYLARVWGVEYKKDSQEVRDMSTLSKSLLTLILERNSSDDEKIPVILVGQGVGGYILKHMLLCLDQKTYSPHGDLKGILSNFFSRIKGILFYTTVPPTKQGNYVSGTNVVPPEAFSFLKSEKSADRTRTNSDFKKLRNERKIHTCAVIQLPGDHDLENLEKSINHVNTESIAVPADVDQFKFVARAKDFEGYKTNFKALQAYIKKRTGMRVQFTQ